MKKWVVAVAVIWVLVLVAAAGVVVVLVNGDDEPSAGPDEVPSTEGEGPSESAPQGDVEEDVPAGLEEFYTQEIAWTDCGERHCGTLEVPIDYADPSAGTIELNLKRAPAAGEEPLGSLVVNPGGPGAPGTSTVDNARFLFAPALLDRYDIVGFDPRGTGESAPVDCLSDAELDEYVAADPDPDNPAEVEEVVDNQEEFWEGCAENTGELLGHVSTIEVARDMDVLRAALGDDKLDYFGFSYGTRLGATYAELFPERVGRFVLDGAVDPSLPTLEGSLSQARGFETALRAYVQDCVDDGDCFLGDSVEEGLATITDVLARIDREPLPTNQDRDLEIGNAFYGIVTPLYSEDNWSYLDRGLEEALEGRGDTLLMLSDFYGSREGGSYADNSLEAISVINCLDDPWAITAEEVPAYFKRFQRASPTFGRVFAWGLVGCHGIPVESSEPDLEIDGAGADPIVVIGTTRDPATPYEEAVAMAEQLESGVLVSRDGDGHTGYNAGNECVDTAVHDYLIEGTVPEDGLSC